MRAHQHRHQFDAALEVFRDISNAARRENELVPGAARHLARQIRRERESYAFAPPTPSETLETVAPEADAEAAMFGGWDESRLPATWTPFFGRDEEFAALSALLVGASGWSRFRAWAVAAKRNF